MVARAISVPKNSEEFLALGEYMAYASSQFFMEMISTIKDLSTVACNLSLYGVLPTKLWRVLETSIELVQNMSFVFLKYSTVYEAGQIYADEKLAGMIVKLNHDLDTFAATLECLDNIDDINKLVEYRFVMQEIYFISGVDRNVRSNYIIRLFAVH